jgi:hypothetical protein
LGFNDCSGSGALRRRSRPQGTTTGNSKGGDQPARRLGHSSWDVATDSLALARSSRTNDTVSVSIIDADVEMDEVWNKIQSDVMVDGRLVVSYRRLRELQRGSMKLKHPNEKRKR